MKLIVEVEDDKAVDLKKILAKISYIKVQEEKPQLLHELKEAVDNLNLVLEGKMEATPARDLLNEL